MQAGAQTSPGSARRYFCRCRRRTLLQQCVLDGSWQSLLFGCQMDPCIPHTRAQLRPSLFSPHPLRHHHLFFLFHNKRKALWLKENHSWILWCRFFCQADFSNSKDEVHGNAVSAALSIRFWCKFELADMFATLIYRCSAGNLDKIQKHTAETQPGSECCWSTASSP